MEIFLILLALASITSVITGIYWYFDHVNKPRPSLPHPNHISEIHPPRRPLAHQNEGLRVELPQRTGSSSRIDFGEVENIPINPNSSDQPKKIKLGEVISSADYDNLNFDELLWDGMPEITETESEKSTEHDLGTCPICKTEITDEEQEQNSSIKTCQSCQATYHIDCISEYGHQCICGKTIP